MDPKPIEELMYHIRRVANGWKGIRQKFGSGGASNEEFLLLVALKAKIDMNSLTSTNKTTAVK